MPRYNYLLIFVVVLAVLLTVGVIFKQNQREQMVDSQKIVDEVPSQNAEQFSYQCENGKTAFDVLSANAKVDFSESSFGKLVTSINGKSQEDGKYWLYSVDGKEATVGATSFECVGGEQIEWELK